MTVKHVDITYWKARKLTLIESLKDSSALQSEPKTKFSNHDTCFLKI